MEPVEINAGRFYLRALRGDERVDDLPALRELVPGADRDELARREAGWESEDLLSWAVCVQTDVELHALVEVEVPDPETGRAVLRGHARRTAEAGAVEEGSAAVRRFAEGALGLDLDG